MNILSILSQGWVSVSTHQERILRRSPLSAVSSRYMLNACNARGSLRGLGGNIILRVAMTRFSRAT